MLCVEREIVIPCSEQLQQIVEAGKERVIETVGARNSVLFDEEMESSRNGRKT